jgi:undecaprenyl-diphosphatase
MNIIKAIIMGIIQGVTEFLPVSSSGHLALTEQVLSLNLKRSIAFDVLLHGGTLVVIIAYFRREVKSVILGFFKKDEEGRKLILPLIMAVIATGTIAFLLKGIAEESFSYPERVASFLIITGTLLLLTRFSKEKSTGEISLLSAIIIGAVQGAAIFPGISRSGTTIGVGLFLGLRRELAARFSFLISIPAISAALILELPQLTRAGNDPSLFLPYLFGTIAAALSGYFSLALLIKMVKRLRLTPFGYYCLGLGIFIFIYYLGG